MTSQWCMCVHACACARDVACACAPGMRRREGDEGGGERERRGKGSEGWKGTKANGDKTWDQNISELL